MTGTNAICFVHKHEVLHDRQQDATYGHIECDYREGKVEPKRTRLTFGGDMINYLDDCCTPTADLLIVKLLLNSIISTPTEKSMTMDIKNFYLNTPLKRYKYLCFKMNDIPEDVQQVCTLEEKATDEGWVYAVVRESIYGLMQAGLLVQELLATKLATHRYTQSKLTPGLWTHKTRPIQFCLIVDNFGVK